MKQKILIITDSDLDGAGSALILKWVLPKSYDICIFNTTVTKFRNEILEWLKFNTFDNYDIVADITNIEDGYCVTLKSVFATVGYSDFLVQIDIRHQPDTCSYNAILSHEDEHIRAYLSVIDDYKKELKDSIYTAADSITPIFVRNASDIDAAITELNAELQAHPDLILIKQKIKAAEEIRNKRVDQHDTGETLRKCFE